MIPETIYGLPTHALVIHAVVVLIPLGALGVIAMVAVPRWRATLRWPVLFVVAAGVAAIPVATRTGHRLKASLVASQQLGGAALEKVDKHQQLGQTMIWFGLALLIMTVALVLVDRAGRKGPVLVVVLVLAVVAAGAATVQTIRTGHAGSTAVFNPGG
jgi:hypothetical protein